MDTKQSATNLGLSFGGGGGVGFQLQASADLNIFSRMPVIGYPRDFHVNYAPFNGFFESRNVSHSFQNLWKVLQVFSLNRISQKKFLISQFGMGTIN